MSEIRDKLKEMTKEILRLYEVGACKQECIHPSWQGENACLYCMAGQILAIPEIAVVDRKAELPEVKLLEDCDDGYARSTTVDYRRGWGDAMDKTAGYVKEVKENETEKLP